MRILKQHHRHNDHHAPAPSLALLLAFSAARSASTYIMTPRTEVIASVVAYSICSGTLVLLNKLILHDLPYPSLVVSFQLTATLLFILTAKYSNKLPVDDLEWKYVVPYLYYIVAFAMGVYCNMRSLSISNVETVIVFRAMSPCLVAFLDAIFLGREYPSTRSWCGLLLIVLGAYGYASFDEQFQTQGLVAYGWPTAYLLIISFEMCYGKRIIRSVDLKTKSGPVLCKSFALRALPVQPRHASSDCRSLLPFSQKTRTYLASGQCCCSRILAVSQRNFRQTEWMANRFHPPRLCSYCWVASQVLVLATVAGGVATTSVRRALHL